MDISAQGPAPRLAPAPGDSLEAACSLQTTEAGNYFARESGLNLFGLQSWRELPYFQPHSSVPSRDKGLFATDALIAMRRLGYKVLSQSALDARYEIVNHVTRKMDADKSGELLQLAQNVAALGHRFIGEGKKFEQLLDSQGQDKDAARQEVYWQIAALEVYAHRLASACGIEHGKPERLNMQLATARHILAKAATVRLLDHE